MKYHFLFWAITLLFCLTTCYYKPVYNGKPITLSKLKRVVQKEYDYNAFMAYTKDAWRQDSVGNQGLRLYIGGLLEERFDFTGKSWDELCLYFGEPKSYHFDEICYVYYYVLFVNEAMELKKQLNFYVCDGIVSDFSAGLNRKPYSKPPRDSFIIIPNVKGSFIRSFTYKGFLSYTSDFWQQDSLGKNGFRLLAADILKESFVFKDRPWGELYKYLGKANSVSDYGDGCKDYRYFLANPDFYFIQRVFYVYVCNDTIRSVSAVTLDG
jgi:hypothetical protein